MLNELLTALALVFVIEGIIPFLNPASLRRMLAIVARMDDMTLRVIGLTSMISGVIMLYLVH